MKVLMRRLNEAMEYRGELEAQADACATSEPQSEKELQDCSHPTACEFETASGEVWCAACGNKLRSGYEVRGPGFRNTNHKSTT